MSFLTKCWRKIFFNLFKIVKATGKNIFFKFHSIQKLLALEETFLFLDNASRTCRFLIFGDFYYHGLIKFDNKMQKDMLI